VLEHVDPDDFADPLVSIHSCFKVVQHRHGERWVGPRKCRKGNTLYQILY
jgi:hypothetical protein